MSLQKKLDKTFADGFTAGVNAACDIFDNAIREVDGIGPKTMAKLKKAIKDKAMEYHKAGRLNNGTQNERRPDDSGA